MDQFLISFTDLQLKPEHRPLIELKKWPIVLQRLSGVKPADLPKELPKIYLRRDAKLMPRVEENVRLMFY